MARETKAERLAREAAEVAEREANQAAEYLPKLMTALQTATTVDNYELTVRDGMFHLRDRDAYDSTLLLSPTYTNRGYNDLENLEWDLEQKAAERAEAERRRLAKQTALSKLTKEERELLGL